jgi:hypothetical protein
MMQSLQPPTTAEQLKVLVQHWQFEHVEGEMSRDFL